MADNIMPHPWIPNSAENIRKYLMKELGISNVLELFNDVPKELILNRALNVGFGKSLSEYEMRRLFNRIVSKNKVFIDPPPFIGGGFCAHYVPAALKYLLSRGEFYTAYTPYQAEINQGILQALFEYQSLIAELYDVDVVNASMYNGSTAAAEAVRMALRIKKHRNKVVLASTAHPEVREAIKTWLQGLNVNVVEVSMDKESGELGIEELKNVIDDKTAALYIEYPNFFGIVERGIKEYIDIAHEKGALAIVYANPIALGVFKPPGSMGADIVVGDTQPLGSGLNFGGPTAGILGIRYERELLRQLPGRLIGATKTIENSELGFTMILQTREQHIRRERATSNITTNSSLMAIAAAIYLTLLGSNGIRKLGEVILGRTYYAMNELSKLDGVQVPAIGSRKSVFFREFTVKFEGDARIIVKKLIEKGIHIGPPLSKFYNDKFMKSCSLICVSELHTKSDIDLLASKIEEVIKSHV